MLKRFLSIIAPYLPFEQLVQFAKRPLFLPFYHVVSNQDLPHIKHLYSVTSVERFHSDLCFLQRNFKSISSTDLYKLLKEEKRVSERYFFLSFDDGLREFYDVAAPVLLQKGIAATCFVNSAFVDNKDMFYRHKASVLIDKIEKMTLSSAQRKEFESVCERYGLVYHSALDLLKISYQNKNLLDELASIVELSFTEYLSVQQPYMTSEQIRDLQQKGFTIGAHSVSHPRYQLLSEDEQIKQTVDCISFLKNQFNITDGLFAFPYTDVEVRKSFFEKTAKDIRMSFGTAGLKFDVIKSNLQRTAMEQSGFDSAASIVKTEYFSFILKKLIGKHIVYRD